MYKIYILLLKFDILFTILFHVDYSVTMYIFQLIYIVCLIWYIDHIFSLVKIINIKFLFFMYEIKLIKMKLH